MKSIFDIHSLPAQMILSFIGVVMLTAAAVGIPVLWLIREQLDRQAWSQVDQGQRAALALYEAKQSEVASLAILTAQRPTLRELLFQKNGLELEDYLETLRAGAGLDLVAVCEATDTTIASTEPSLATNPCQSWRLDGFQIHSTESLPQVWLTATYPVEGEGTEKWDILVGMVLDDDFVTLMRHQTGLENTIRTDGQPVATSFTGGIEQLVAISPYEVPSNVTEDAIYTTFELAGQPYYSAQSPLDKTGIEVEVALGVAEITATQQRLMLILASSIIAVAAMVSVLGVFLARRISQPLVRLADTAGEFSKGDLSTSVEVDTQVREVQQVASALENARVDLQRTLTNLEREKAWVNHLLDSIVEGIVTLDHQGHISFFSKGAEQITGWSRDEVLDRSFDQVFRLVETETPSSDWIPAPGARKKIIVELSGERQAVLSFTGARLAPAEAGDTLVALVFRDISEEEIIRRILGDFLANIAHEFRTPLSAAAASTELLMDQAQDLSSAELQDLLTSLHLGILGLQTLVDNLLESASIEAGRFWISPHLSDLGKIIAEAVQVMHPLLEKYDQRLIVELPADIPVVYADERRIVQVLVNLLSNASKYGPAEAEITIIAMVNQYWVRVQVADRGSGIPHDRQSQVFRRFMYPGQLDESAKAGARLGLSVVKAVVEAHGGQVGVEDRPGGGSIFWFTLPKGDKE